MRPPAHTAPRKVVDGEDVSERLDVARSRHVKDVAEISFKNLPQPDQPLARIDKRPHSVGRFAANMNLGEPADPRQLRQSFGICLVGLVEAEGSL